MRIAEFKNGATTYRDMTPERIEEFERQQAEMPAPELSPEERLAIMEDAFAELCEVIFNG